MKTGRAVIALVAMGSPVFSQQPAPAQEPALTATASEAVVDATATDRKGHHIRGLTAGDFSVYEDGRLQRVTSFAAVAGAKAPADEPDVAARARVQNGVKAQPTLLTVFIDLADLHPDSLARACAAASRFVARSRDPNIQFAIYWVDTGLHLAMPFSPDRQRTLEALDQLKNRTPYGKLSVAERQSTLAENRDAATSANPVLDAHVTSMTKTWYVTLNSLQAKTLFVALRAMALTYRDLPGRKNVILFSEGFPHPHDAGATLQAVVDAANRANMAIYVVDAAGLPLDGAGNQNSAMASDKRPEFVAGGMDQFDWIQTIGTEVHGDLGVIATYTGGFLVHDSNNLDAALNRVSEDASEFYTLGYTPATREFDGSFRKIKVEMNTKGLRVRYRRGYWAIPPGRDVLMTPAAAQLLASIHSGEIKPAFVPQLNAALVPDPGGGFEVSAAVALPGKLLRFTKANGQYIGALSVVLIARDLAGEVLAVHEQHGDVKLNRNEQREFSAGAFNWQGHVAIPVLQPLRIQAYIRFADGTVGASGIKEVPVPDSSSGLRLTGLVLSRRADTSACKRTDQDPLCVQGVRMMLPAQPVFSHSSNLLVYFSVLGLGLSPENRPDLGITFRLRSAQTENAWSPKNFVTVAEAAPRSLGVLAEFDLAALAPGQYTLEAAARDKIEHARAIGEAQLTVQ